MMNGKALPERPGMMDGDYGNRAQFGGPLAGQENSYQRSPRLGGSPRMGSPKLYGSPMQNGRTVDGVNGRNVLEGYRDDIMNGFAGEKARYNPMNTKRPQSSMLLNVNDPIQVHLLVETALGDSTEYEVLAPEEVDDLKKQCQSLKQRIEQTRQNLAIQSKYRDAAISMSKLYNPVDRKEGRRRSLIPHHRSDSVKEADIERIRSEERCEELALELWSLEKRLVEPQNRLLKHTAGVLQMTHKGPKKVSKGQGAQHHGIPGSPESMYTYHNSRNSVEPLVDDGLFDDRSLYRDAERLDMFNDYNKRNSFEPPPISPPPRSQGREQMQIIAKTERKLEELNSRLRKVVLKADPEREDSLDIPVASTGSQGQAGEALVNYLGFMEMGIDALDKEHDKISSYQQELLQNHDDLSINLEAFQARHVELNKQLEEANRRQEESDAAMEETIEDMNREIRGILLPFDPDRPELPDLTGTGMQDQLLYFQKSVGAIEMELARVNENSATQGFHDDHNQMQTILMGLWDIIQSGYGEIRKRKQERRLTRSANGLPDDEDDMSDDEAGDPDEPFSLQAFSKKVQWLYGQATKLKDQKKVLQVQIKQQRELNNKSDATKDAELSQRKEDLDRVQALLVRTEADSDRVREQLSDVMEKLDESRQRGLLDDQKRSVDESSAIQAAHDELDQRDQTIMKLEEELEELKDDHSISKAEIEHQLSASESRIADLVAKVEAATSERAKAEKLLTEKETSIEEKEHEIESMNMKLAELQTEVTIARAELDGAYGSRAQRAAEVAANPVIAREIDNLTRNNASLAAEITALKSSSASAGQGSKESDERMITLKKELAETIEEYEEMTKASIEWEKERERLEETIDKLRDQREKLDAELSDEKVRWLGMRSPGMDGPPSGAGMTSTTVLKDEFKKMMRTTRAENAKTLRAEQAERRRLEDELRSLKKQLGPGKSGLSQSVKSS